MQIHTGLKDFCAWGYNIRHKILTSFTIMCNIYVYNYHMITNTTVPTNKWGTDIIKFLIPPKGWCHVACAIQWPDWIHSKFIHIKRVRTPFMARCTRYNNMWWSLSVTWDRSVVFPRALRFPLLIKLTATI
jgi:hypothetical protein